MKRLHIHVAVADLQQSIGFYSALFASEPSLIEADYAKWMLDDPRVNFAISQRGQTPGLDHLGIQAENADELNELEQRITQAALPHLAQTNSQCCYAESNKHWSVDPSGIAWETFHTLNQIPTYGAQGRDQAETSTACASEANTASSSASSCCAPAANPAAKVGLPLPSAQRAGTCGSTSNSVSGARCC